MVSVLPVTINNAAYKKMPVRNQLPAQTVTAFCAAPQKTQKQKDKDDKKFYLLPALVVLGGAAIAIASQGRGVLSAKKATRLASDNMPAIPALNDFPQDVRYRKAIVKAMNLPEEEATKLRSIIGTQELTSLVKDFATTPQVYSPGTKSYTDAGKVFFRELENVKSFEFGANLHMHTINSDGKINISNLLDKAAQYGDKRFAKTGKPFVFAITDHDSVHGCREAIDIIRANPEKYKNIRLVLGIENTTTMTHPTLNKTGQIHLLSYGVNPYSKEIDGFIVSRVRKNHEALKKSISQINKKYAGELSQRGIEYDFDEFAAIVPSVAGCAKPANYLLKDYLQFKLIHNDLYKNNTELKKYFSSHNIQMQEIPLTSPVGLIPKYPDYSGGKQYFDYYYDALKSSIIKSNPTANSEEISKLIPPISAETRRILNGIEADILDPKSSAFVPSPEIIPFADAVTQLSKMEGVSLGLAHPGVVIPKDAIRGQEKLPELYEQVYNIFKANGKERAVFSEDFYQIYYSSADKGVLAKLREFSAKHKLLPTGSLDTHTEEIYGTSIKPN